MTTWDGLYSAPLWFCKTQSSIHPGGIGVKRVLAAAFVLVLAITPLASGQQPSEPAGELDFRPVPAFVDQLATQTPEPTKQALRERLSVPRVLAGATPGVVEQPKPQKVVITPRPLMTVPPQANRILGKASWYCRPGVSICSKGYPAGGLYGAAGPGLRAAMCGNQASNCWRGRTVYVNKIPVKLIDWCQCYWKQPKEKLIDLYYSVFLKTGGQVVIAWR